MVAPLEGVDLVQGLGPELEQHETQIGRPEAHHLGQAQHHQERRLPHPSVREQEQSIPPVALQERALQEAVQPVADRLAEGADRLVLVVIRRVEGLAVGLDVDLRQKLGIAEDVPDLLELGTALGPELGPHPPEFLDPVFRQRGGDEGIGHGVSLAAGSIEDAGSMPNFLDQTASTGRLRPPTRGAPSPGLQGSRIPTPKPGVPHPGTSQATSDANAIAARRSFLPSVLPRRGLGLLAANDFRENPRLSEHATRLPPRGRHLTPDLPVFGRRPEPIPAPDIAFGRRPKAAAGISIAFGRRPDAMAATQIAFGRRPDTVSATWIVFGRRPNAVAATQIVFGRRPKRPSETVRRRVGRPAPTSTAPAPSSPGPPATEAPPRARPGG